MKFILSITLMPFFAVFSISAFGFGAVGSHGTTYQRAAERKARATNSGGSSSVRVKRKALVSPPKPTVISGGGVWFKPKVMYQSPSIPPPPPLKSFGGGGPEKDVRFSRSIGIAPTPAVKRLPAGSSTLAKEIEQWKSDYLRVKAELNHLKASCSGSSAETPISGGSIPDTTVMPGNSNSKVIASKTVR